MNNAPYPIIDENTSAAVFQSVIENDFGCTIRCPILDKQTCSRISAGNCIVCILDMKLIVVSEKYRHKRIASYDQIIQSITIDINFLPDPPGAQHRYVRLSTTAGGDSDPAQVDGIERLH